MPYFSGSRLVRFGLLLVAVSAMQQASDSRWTSADDPPPARPKPAALGPGPIQPGVLKPGAEQPPLKKLVPTKEAAEAPKKDEPLHIQFEFAAHKGAVTVVAFSSPNHLLSGGEDGACRLWDLKTRTEISAAKTPCKGKVLCVATALDEARIFMAGEDNIIHEWDSKTGLEIRTLSGHKAAITSLALRAGELISAGRDGQVLRWDLKTGKFAPLSEEAADAKAVQQMATSRDGNWAITISEDGSLVAHAGGKATPLTEPLESPATNVTTCNDRHYAVGLSDGAVRIWLFDGKRHLRVQRNRPAVPVLCMRMSTDGSYLVTLDREGNLEVLSLLPVHGSHQSVVDVKNASSAAISTTGQAVALGLGDGKIRISQPPKFTFSENHLRQLFVLGLIGHLRASEFDVLDYFAARFRQEKLVSPWGEHRLRMFYATLATEPAGPLGGGSLQPAREKWRKERPQSKAALLTQAQVHIYDGWKSRGLGFAGTVTEDGARTYQENLKAAQILHTAADGIPGDDAEQICQGLEAAKGLGTPREEVDKLTEKLMKVDARYFPAHQAMAEYLLPRWHGEPGDLEAYAAKVADQIGGDEGAEVYAWIASRVLRYNPSLDFFFAHRFEYDRLLRGISSLSKRGYLPGLQLQEICLYAVLKQDHATAAEQLARLATRGDPMEKRIWIDQRVISKWKLWAAGPKPSPSKLAIMAHWDAATGVWFSADGKVLFTRGTGVHSDIRTWNAETGEYLGLFPQAMFPDTSSAQMSADRKLFAVAEYGDKTSTLFVHQLDGEGPPRKFSGNLSTIHRLAFSPGGKYLAGTCQDGNLCIWDIEKPDAPKMLKPKKESFIAMTFSPDSKWLFGVAPETIAIWNVETEEATFEKVPLIRGGCNNLSFHPNGNELIAALGDSQMNWNVAQRVGAAVNPPMALSAVDTSPNGKLLSSASAGEGDGPPGRPRKPTGDILLWDLQMGRMLTKFQGGVGEVWSTRFSPDGKALASCSQDGTVRVWDIAKFSAPAKAEK